MVTKNNLIAVASANYPDGCVGQCWDEKNSRLRPNAVEVCGDVLAFAVASSLSEMYDEAVAENMHPLLASQRLLETQSSELLQVAGGIYDAYLEDAATQCLEYLLKHEQPLNNSTFYAWTLLRKDLHLKLHVGNVWKRIEDKVGRPPSIYRPPAASAWELSTEELKKKLTPPEPPVTVTPSV